MRKLLVSACFAFALLVSGVVSPTAQADHGYRGNGYGSGYGGGYESGYGAPGCHGHHAGYGGGYGGSGYGYGSGYGVGYAAQYQTSIVPVYPGGIYQSYSFGGSPFGGYSNYGQIGSPFGSAGYGAGYGGLNFGSVPRNTLPRVQLRVGY